MRGKTGRKFTREGPVGNTEGRVKAGEEFILLKRKITKRDSGGEGIMRMVSWRELCSEKGAGRRLRERA